MIILKQLIIIVESLTLLNDRCQTAKENQTLPPSDYDINTENWMAFKTTIWCFNRKYNALVFITCLFPLSASFNLQARLLKHSSPRAKFSTVRKYTFPFFEFKSF